MNIKQYIAETEKQYHLRLKTLVPLDDDAMNKIEMCLAKYQPLSIGRPKKTILHRQPVDFPSVDNAEIYIVDMSFGIPAAPHIIHSDIRKILNAPEKYVVVRTKSEPGELQSEIINAIDDIEQEALKKGLTPLAVLDDSDYNDAVTYEPTYGNEYNAAFLSYLGKVEKERKDAIEKVENAPFNWLDLPDRVDQEPVQDNSDFNAKIPDAPKVGGDTSSKIPVNYSIFGSFNPSAGEVRRLFTDKNGKKVVLSRKIADGEM